MSLQPTDTPARAIVLVTRSAIAATPLQEMEHLVRLVSAAQGDDCVTFAFTEQGEPSLWHVVRRLREDRYSTVVLVPLLLPMEPNFVAFLARTVQRWRNESPGPWPAIHIGHQGPSGTIALQSVLAELIASACAVAPVEPPERTVSEGSIVPSIARRVLVCLGGPCQAAGAALIWGRLRNEQKRLNLPAAGQGMRSARTSCLGPCSLAPVIQVYPEGVFYGGVDERGTDRIIQEHLLENRIVEDLVYYPSEMKQRIRPT